MVYLHLGTLFMYYKSSNSVTCVVCCRWLWAEAGAQPELENMLEIGGFGYPAMAVLNAKKMKYTILRGSFSSDGINEFLR